MPTPESKSRILLEMVQNSRIHSVLSAFVVGAVMLTSIGSVIHHLCMLTTMSENEQVACSSDPENSTTPSNTHASFDHSDSDQDQDEGDCCPSITGAFRIATPAYVPVQQMVISAALLEATEYDRSASYPEARTVRPIDLMPNPGPPTFILNSSFLICSRAYRFVGIDASPFAEAFLKWKDVPSEFSGLLYSFR